MATTEDTAAARRVKVGEARRSFDLPLSCDEAFPLFTPLGETRWVEGWSPRILVGDGHAPAVGDVFETQGHGRRFLWTVVEVAREASGGRRVRYVRASDGFQVGEVEVRCTPTAPGASAGTASGSAAGTASGSAAGTEASRVEVRYRLVGMGDEGAAHVEAFFAPGAFEAFIDTWPRHITAALAREAAG